MDHYPAAGPASAAGAGVPPGLMHGMPMVSPSAFLNQLPGPGDNPEDAGPSDNAPPQDGDRTPEAYAGGSRTASRVGPLVCQVETCRVGLEGLKEYHQRYKVCEVHLKMESIERDGVRLRFCQQCGRFQPLEDFDDNKRSCRSRLHRHNARRRKRGRDPPGFSPSSGGGAVSGAFDEMAAIQEACQFASATLMHTATHPGAVGGGDPTIPDDDPAQAAASIAGLPFGGGLTAMPYVPSSQVMQLLLKGYAGMFHYTLEDVRLRPLQQPTQNLLGMTMPTDATMAAAAAAALAAPPDEAAVAQLMAIHGAAMHAVASEGATPGGQAGQMDVHNPQQQQQQQENHSHHAQAGLLDDATAAAIHLQLQQHQQLLQVAEAQQAEQGGGMGQQSAAATAALGALSDLQGGASAANVSEALHVFMSQQQGGQVQQL